VTVGICSVAYLIFIYSIYRPLDLIYVLYSTLVLRRRMLGLNPGLLRCTVRIDRRKNQSKKVALLTKI
jgi:hypothetical protein